VSEFNRAELDRSGYRSTTVVPVLVDLEAMGAHQDPATERQLTAGKQAGGAVWLFVGRLSPNKRQDRVIRAFAVYRRLYDPSARLYLVGSPVSEVYPRTLERFIDGLGLRDAVVMTGSVSQPALVSYYRHADVFVCLSEHEGFCIPLLEAMWHRVPIVALDSSAIGETVGGAGVVLPMPYGRQPSAALVAAAVHRIRTDGELHDQFVRAGVDRAADFALDKTSARFAAAIASLVDSQ
jgi:glycosyltransferase involved in cell wall biosynthesis